MTESRPACRCGHPAVWHDHLHDRNYCGVCSDCRAYNPPRTTWRDWLFWLRAGLAMWRTRR